MKTHLPLANGAGHALVLKTFPGVLELRTQRCLLRAWRDDDLPDWVLMNANPEVRRHFSFVATEEQALGEAQRIRKSMAQRGWGPWALEIPGKLPFAGFVGLIVPTWQAHFTPAVEIGWRLTPEAWGQGYASEAALAALAFAFEVLQLQEVVSITIPANTPSRRVMQRIGMQHDEAGDFLHPTIDPTHPNARHVLYRLARAAHDTPANKAQV
jgi:RimJ/RimL family protein N-acetyltransferase